MRVWRGTRGSQVMCRGGVRIGCNVVDSASLRCDLVQQRRCRTPGRSVFDGIGSPVALAYCASSARAAVHRFSPFCPDFNSGPALACHALSSHIGMDCPRAPMGRQTIPPVHGINADPRLNRALWLLAEGLRQFKASSAARYRHCLPTEVIRPSARALAGVNLRSASCIADPRNSAPRVLSPIVLHAPRLRPVAVAANRKCNRRTVSTDMEGPLYW
jgi:hypothetical protein